MFVANVLESIVSLPARIAAGIVIFATLAVVDLLRHGRSARRWREYAFLAGVVLAAMVYGAANDQISSTISWEYFYYGKELSLVLGPDTPPDSSALHWQAALVGVKASWSAGLLIGATLLIANNPRRDHSPLPFRRLVRCVPMLLAACIATSILFGLLGWRGGLTACSAQFGQLVYLNLWRPARIMACWGEHLGAYVGGAIGTIWMAIRVYRRV